MENNKINSKNGKPCLASTTNRKSMFMKNKTACFINNMSRNMKNLSNKPKQKTMNNEQTTI